MGSVWAAEHLALRSRVAVKVIDNSLVGNRNALLRFEQEARAAATLRSAHVVQVLDFGVDAGNPYLVMELLEGESLATRLATRGALSALETWTVVSHVAHAMSRAHAQGFVHRDLKPDNVFLIEDVEGLLVKVLDFGVAKTLVGPTMGLTATGALLGTPRYASPEQAEGKPVDVRSDLWSLGVVTFECLTGELPFDAQSLPAILSAICFDPIVVPSALARVPVGFDAWFARAVQRDRARRFQSAKEMAEELRPLIGPGVQTSWVGPLDDATTQVSIPRNTLHLHTYPSAQPERRGEIRIPSSIPAGIDRQRDLRHAALIHNTSRGGALLVTRNECHLEQELVLTLHLDSADHGEVVSARVTRVTPRADDVWKFEVGVRFVEPLSDELIARLEARARYKAPR
jgi:serine/threonine protein kinase